MVNQHIVFGTIVPIEKINNHELRDIIINDTGVVQGFYNGNRLDDEGYFIGIKLKTTDHGSNFNLSDFIKEFSTDEEVYINQVHQMIEKFKDSESLKGHDISDITSELKEPQLFIIPETE